MTLCDIVNVPIFTYVRDNTILAWDEYRQASSNLYAQFLAQLREMPSPEWDRVLAKPVWITGTGVTYVDSGMTLKDYTWGNERELALFRVACFDALASRPDAAATVYDGARNLENWDDRDSPENRGILRFDGSITASYEVMGYANGVPSPGFPLHYELAEDFTFTVY